MDKIKDNLHEEAHELSIKLSNQGGGTPDKIMKKLMTRSSKIVLNVRQECKPLQMVILKSLASISKTSYARPMVMEIRQKVLEEIKNSGSDLKCTSVTLEKCLEQLSEMGLIKYNIEVAFPLRELEISDDVQLSAIGKSNIDYLASLEW